MSCPTCGHPMQSIITHPGQAHRDDFLACCILMARYGISAVVRRDPTEADIDNATTFIVDVGGRSGQHWFDHHQLPRDAEPTCALSLVLKSLGLYDIAVEVFPWVKPTELIDSKGPFEAAQQYGMSPDALFALQSPIEAHLLRMFGKVTSIDENDAMFSLMRYIGNDLLDHIGKVQDRINMLSRKAIQRHVRPEIVALNATCVDRADQPTLGLEVYCKQLTPEPVITITQDDRGDGFSLFRRNDDKRVDFSRIEGKPGVVFAHKNGFVAKVSKDADVDQLLVDSIV